MDDKVRYEVRVLGQLGPAARRAVAEMSVEVMSQATVLSGAFDQAALHEVFKRIQALGLELFAMTRNPHGARHHRPCKKPSPMTRQG
jgi:hypothetical protein